MRYAVLPLILTVAAVLIASGGGKLGSLGSASATLHALRLPVRKARLVVAAVATIELGLAAALLGTSGTTLTAVAIATSILMSSFFAIGVRARRLGSTDECGCFGGLLSTRVSRRMSVRNATLAAMALGIVGYSVTATMRSSAIATIASGPRTAALAVTATAACVLVGALFARSSTGSAEPNAVPTPLIGPALLAPDGTIVDPYQRALRGRAQLLVFVRPGCSSCTTTTSAVAARLPELERVADARVIVAAGDTVAATAPPEFDGEPIHIDVAGQVAARFEVPAGRPSAFLLSTDGTVLLPYAEGLSEVLSLIEVVAAAGSESAAGTSAADTAGEA